MAGPAAILEIRSVGVVFGGLVALENVTFSINANEIVSLIGPNGAGKTTLLNVIAGTVGATSGEVRLRGEAIQGLRPEQVNARGIGRTFQSAEIFAGLTVLENAMAGGVAATGLGLAPCFNRWGRARRVSLALARHGREALDFVGLSHCINAVGSTLPTGQGRLLGIARVMMSGARVLLLDEPGAGLNDTEKNALVRVILRLSNEGYTVLLVEHDMALVAEVSDRIVVLDQGRIIADGAPQEVRRQPAVIEAYLGRPREAAEPQAREESVVRLQPNVARHEPLLEIRDLCIRYGGVTALQNVTVRLNNTRTH